VGRLESDELSFVWVDAEAIPHKPVSDTKEAICTFVSNSSMTCTCGNVTVRPLCQVDSGILGFGDLGRDCKDGIQRGVVPKREIGHMRCHMIRRMTSEDYTSQA